MKLSTESYRTVLFSLPPELCSPVSRSNLHTKYLPARTTYVRFHNLPAMLSTSLAVASLLLWGHCSNSNLFIASIFSRGTEILIT